MWSIVLSAFRALSHLICAKIYEFVNILLFSLSGSRRSTVGGVFFSTTVLLGSLWESALSAHFGALAHDHSM